MPNSAAHTHPPTGIRYPSTLQFAGGIALTGVAHDSAVPGEIIFYPETCPPDPLPTQAEGSLTVHATGAVFSVRDISWHPVPPAHHFHCKVVRA